MRKYTTKSWLGRAAALGLGTALVAGVSLIGATSAQAAPGDTYSISGVVNDGSAAPLAGVEASIDFTEVGSSPSHYTDVTGVDGSFQLDGIPDGAHTVNFNLDGYGDTAVNVTVAGADVTAPTATMLPQVDTSGVTVTITGTGLVGETLTAVSTGWPAGTDLAYEWYSFTPGMGDPIAGATASTYVVTNGEIGRSVGVYVYGSKAGVFASTGVQASNPVSASAPKKATAPAPTDLAAYLQTHGSTPAAQTTAGLPAAPLDPGVAHTANLPWNAADSFVDVYIFSTPTLVGTFPVVNGVAQITLGTAVMAKLAAGNHTLVVTGQTSGAVQSITIAIAATLAVTGTDNPVVPIAVASLLLLLGAALLITRRRIGQKI